MQKQEKVIAVLQGFEKDPGEDLVIEVDLNNISESDLKDAFKEFRTSIKYGALELKKQHEKIIYEMTGITIDTSKLAFFIELVRVACE